MKPLDLFRVMARARAFEDAIAELWRAGRISGEMHLGTGEEAIAAAVAAHLRRGDGVAIDHRSTPILAALGVDLTAMLKEMLGREDGLCRGKAGHMHLMSKAHLAAASGIVGAEGPIAAGFALAAQHAGQGGVAVALFGDGAANQGMLIEAMNLAAAWNLPVVFVCKDNGWAITTRTRGVTGGELCARARAFGLRALDVDGREVREVWRAAGEAIGRARRGKGPSFLRAKCARLDGHILGDPMVRVAQEPVGEGADVLKSVLAAAVARDGGSVVARAKSVASMVGLLWRARARRRDTRDDPIERARRDLGRAAAAKVEADVAREVRAAVEAALAPEVSCQS